MNKLFFFDIDGTLLDSNRKILPSTKDAIKLINSRGDYTCIATGRSPVHCFEIARESGMNGYIIGHNGSTIYDLFNNTFEQSGFVPQIVIDKMIETAQKHKRELIWHMGVNSYSCYFGIDKRTDITDEKYFKAGIDSRKNDDWNEVKHLLKENNNIVQITIKAESSLIEKLLVELSQELSAYASVNEVSRVYIDCNPLGVNKFTGCRIIQKKLSIKNSDCYAFGDSGNDFEMIKNIGNGIAMGNATPQLKKVAKFICEDNDSHGIYNFVVNELNNK
jgi:Cof subfamily protein (haloacid dehalogenase superfamily)